MTSFQPQHNAIINVVVASYNIARENSSPKHQQLLVGLCGHSSPKIIDLELLKLHVLIRDPLHRAHALRIDLLHLPDAEEGGHVGELQPHRVVVDGFAGHHFAEDNVELLQLPDNVREQASVLYAQESNSARE